jgi:hypothetical protein
MPVSAETLRLLMDAGLEGDDLLRVVESIDKTPTKERTANAVRQARHRAKKAAANVTSNVTDNVTESVTPRAHVEDNSSNLEISKKENKKTAREHLADFKASLLADLGDERLEAFVLHRKAKRGALTGYGAKLFRQDCNDCGIAVAAGADMAMSRGWITVKAEWLTNRTTGPPSKPKQPTLATMWHDEARQHGIIDDPSNPPNGRVVPSLTAGQNQSPGVARRYAGT